MKDLREELLECLEKSRRFPNDTERAACFVACLNEALKPLGARLVVTGGFGVELLTGASYRTADVDLKVEGLPSALEELQKALDELGKRPGREWLLTGLAKAIDLLPSGSEEVLEIVTPCGKLYVERPEKLLVRYLAAWKYWESKEDRDKAFALAYALEDLLDWGKVENLSKKEGVEDELGELRGWLSKLRS